MPFTKEDKILIKNLFQLKGTIISISSESLPAKAGMLAASIRCYNSYGLLDWSTVLPAVPDNASSTLILLTNWCFTKMARREIIITVFAHCTS